MKQLLKLVGAAGALALPFAAQGQVLTFEGIAPQTLSPNTAPIGNYYNGGGGPNFGITFSSNAVALCLNTSTLYCSNTSRGDRGDPNSRTGALDFLTGTQTFMTRTAGFTTGFSFFYAAPNTAGAFSVWSGPDGTGTLLAALALGLTPTGPEPCYGALYCPFVPVGLSFAGTAQSVSFAGVADHVIFDDVTFGSTTPGNTVPEPASIVLLGTGLVGVFGAVRRHRKSD